MFADLSNILSDFATRPGELFRSVLAIALVALAVLIVLHLVLVLVGRRPDRPRKSWNLWEKLVYLGILVSVGVLGGTSFFAVLRFGVLDGWLLFAHMFGAGAFTAVLPLVAITWCESSRLGRPSAESEQAATAPRFSWFPRLMFWLLLASGFVVTMTMLLSMLPLFGTDGLHRLLDIHRYSGLVAVVAAVLHLYSVVLQRAGLR
jgi:hypothetical protein